MYEIIPTPEELIAEIFSAEALKERRRNTADEALHQAGKEPTTIQCKNHQVAASLAGTMRTMLRDSRDQFIIKQKGTDVHVCSSKLAQSLIK